MKKLAVLIIMVVVLAGCQQMADKKLKKIELIASAEEVTDTKTNTEAELVMDDYNRLMAKNPREAEVLDFILSKIDQVPKEYVSEMVLGYERIQNSTFRNRHQFMMNDDVQAICVNNFGYDGIPDDLSGVIDVGLRIYIEELKDTGYKLVVKDGKYLPEINYAFYDQFKPYVTDEIKTYLELMNMRKELLFTADQKLPITWDEIFDRILKFEQFLTLYPDSKKTDVIWLNYEYYTKLYLYGTEGTPAFNHSDNELDEWLKVSYSNIYLGNSESQFIRNFKEYLQTMDLEGYKLTEKVDTERNTVLYNLNMQLIY